MASSSPFFHHVSTCIVKPPPQPRTQLNLAPFDLIMLSFHYIQKGLLFSNRLMPPLTIADVVDRLKTSLSAALAHFYPLAGRLVTEEARDEKGNVTGIYLSIDCDGQGAEFTHVVADGITVSDVLFSSTDVPSVVNSFFPYGRTINYDGHVLPLLAVQLTELADGFFLGCCFNHAVGDGVSYWLFFNAWAEIARAGGVAVELSRSPVHDRWFIDDQKAPIKLPITEADKFTERFPTPLYRERIFHLSAGSIARLKAIANHDGMTFISFLQSVCALLWRCITRARRLPAEQNIRCSVAAQNRARLNPPLSPDYFGNCVYPISTATTAGELLAHNLGWAARLVHERVARHTDDAIRKAVAAWSAAPVIYKLNVHGPFTVMLAGSPRFDVYGCDFGWGKPVAARSGAADKFDGKVTFYGGREGAGSMDLEICLEPPFMRALEEDEEFMNVVSPPLELQEMDDFRHALVENSQSS
ncbi:hypothetical protein Cni_G17001 [Canna indica]|uniref:Uncharacterized protein n=1 Tax=Canna indica TaxID=4628 RepID=A0AAQ3QEP8_9LILI|nr:hypothetical protein Cni_G17001 [Canna indica]